MIGCVCAYLLNGALGNYTNLPRNISACATPRCDLDCSLSESIQVYIDFVIYVWVSLTREFFCVGGLYGSWIGFLVFTLWLMLISLKIWREE